MSFCAASRGSCRGQAPHPGSNPGRSQKDPTVGIPVKGKTREVSSVEIQGPGEALPIGVSRLILVPADRGPSRLKVMSHLGAITLSATHCSSPDPKTGQYARGSAVYTAPDADGLHAVYQQMGAPDEPAVETILGGTGRFRDASGEFRVRVTPNVQMGEGGLPVFPGRFPATYTGWISCEEADRNG